MKAKEVLDAVRKLHCGEFSRGDTWVCFEEFRIEAGFGYIAEKRIDLFAMHCHPSKKLERVAYEVKISRTDFTRELQKPTKRWAGFMFSNRFYFAAPAGLIKPKEVPTECGLVEVHDDGNVIIKIKAPWRESALPTWPFVAMVARRAFRREVKGKR